MNSSPTIDFPLVAQERITQEAIGRIDGLMKLVRANGDAGRLLAEISASEGISRGAIRRYLMELRKLFHLPARADLRTIAEHPQLRTAVEYLVCRQDRSDKNTLRSAAGLTVIVPSSGEEIPVEAFLKSLYANPGANASSCYLALKARAMKKCVLKADGSFATAEDLPAQCSVVRFLRKIRLESVAVRRSRSRRHDWETKQEPYVTRDVTRLKPGEVWIGDHTELDFMIFNERGQLDRRWVTAFIDMRTSLIVGYHLNWQPNSDTIALAYHNAVLGRQLRALTSAHAFESINLVNVPEEAMIDNGKDYRSKYTRRIFGKIDFQDEARLAITRTTRLHYTLPYHGQSKAQMERWFRTIQTMLKYLPGFKGNQYQNKPDSLADDVKRGAILPVKEFDAMVAVAVNSYNNRVHRSLSGQSPLQCYLTNYSAIRTIDPRVLDFLLMRVSSKPVRRCQIHLFGHDYYADALLSVNGRRADVYYDPLDLGFVSVYVEGKFVALACNKEMIGQDERGWLRILKERKASEHSMQEEIREMKKGISNDEARMLSLEGELLNMTPVADELLEKKVPTITLLTGLEEEAKKVGEAEEDQALILEIERKAKRRAKQQPLTVAGIIGNIK